MKITKRIISVIAATTVLMLTFSNSAFAEENEVFENKVDVSILISELNASTTGIPSDITREDINRVINEGGIAGAEAL